MDNEELDTTTDNEDELDDLEESGAEGDAPPATDNDGSEAGSKKRIDDLMSKWQTAEAENARLKLELAGKGAGTKAKAKKPSETDEMQEFIREHSRTLLHSTDPRFAKYGLTAAQVAAGDSPAAMQASADGYRKLLDKLESTIRNEVMSEFNLDAGVTGGGATAPAQDFASMPDEDFRKLIARRSNL